MSALVKEFPLAFQDCLYQELQGGPPRGFQSYLPLAGTGVSPRLTPGAAALLWETFVRDDFFLQNSIHSSRFLLFSPKK